MTQTGTTTKMFAARLSRSAARCFSTAPHVYTLPELPYAYSALEPVISGEIMQVTLANSMDNDK